MMTMYARVALAVTVVFYAAVVQAEMRVGIIGLDTSHVLRFTEAMNVKRLPCVNGFRVTTAYQWGSRDIVSATNRYPEYVAEMGKMGVRIVPTIEELIESVDCICLETNDGREHLKQAEKVFRSGKPCFIDKPLAHNLKDAFAIYELGKRMGAKYFSSSCLRYGKVIQAARKGDYGKIRTVSVSSPAPEEVQGTHNAYSWYGIHGFEPYVAVMGIGAEKVSCFRTQTDDAVNIAYADGRLGQLRLFRDRPFYSGYVLPDDRSRPAVMTEGNPGYEPLLAEIATFFKTGVAPFPPEETLEIAALMEAAEMSATRGGDPVSLAEAYDSVCRPVLTISLATAENRPEPILKPFGFKGGYLSELWQTRVTLLGGVKGERAVKGVGLGVQSSLWSDAAVLASLSEREANELMFSLTMKGVELAKGRSFSTPPELLKEIFPKVLAYGRKISGRPGLRPTFALNALVPLDFAAWQLYARAHRCPSFDAMLPSEFRNVQSARHGRCAAITLITYGTDISDVKKLVAEGAFFLKIKIGHKGTQEEMLAKDCARISEIHTALMDAKTPWTDSGEPVYYFDANGRYETKEALLKFIEHLRKIGALNRTAMIEEPFDELSDIDVHDIPVRLVADESAHTVEDAARRMDMGYRAMALKPIAKTLSVSLGIAKAAKARDIPCFCADLTVNPVMVEWNKAVAARLDAFPGIKGLGLVETNGEQNYVNWKTMRSSLPYPDAPWTRTEKGLFVLDDDYWRRSGGVLDGPFVQWENP